MIEINSKAQLEETIKQEEISVIKIGTDWCFNCRSIQRQIESKEQEYPKLKFYWIDLDKLDVGDDLNIEDLPTLIAFKNGKEVSRKKEAELFDWLTFLSQTWV